MNPREKILLLSEMFEVDVSKHIQAVLSEIENSEHYKQLVINVEMASKYQVPYTEKFLKEYEELSINKITSIKDAFIARAKVDYLYQISQPKYFINPIMFNPMEMNTSITMIGELPCYYHNKEMTIDELITNEEISNKDKIKVTNEITKKWAEDAQEIIIDKVNFLISKRNKFYFKGNPFSIFKRGLIYPILIILGNIIFFVSIFSSSKFMNTVLLGHSVSSYFFLFFVIFLFLFEAGELLNIRMEESYFDEKKYCYTYLKSHAYLSVKSFEDSVFKIKKTFLEAIKDKSKVKTPITKVNYLANYRRIILFLESKVNISERKYKESTINAINIIRLTILVLFLLSLIGYAVIMCISYLKGGVI